VDFVQDSHSKSSQGVLHGLHYQIQHPQGKLVRVTQGAVFDVAMDMRRSSPNFAKWVSVELTADNKRQLWVPSGFAHGFVVTSESAEFLYETTDYWYPEHERSLLWCDPTFGVQWPVDGEPKLAAKDAVGKVLAEADCFSKLSIGRPLESITIPRPNFYIPAVLDLLHHLFGQCVCDTAHEI
jgi:dTDP-4-dehydrorhamnose 3,5-epimerase